MKQHGVVLPTIAKGRKMALTAEVIQPETTIAADKTQLPPNDKPVDLVHLSRQTFGSKELEAEVLGLFLNHSRLCFQRLKQAKDANASIEAAHAIKGSARAIGAFALADLAEQLEQAVKTGQFEEATPAIDDIEKSLELTNSYISHLIDEA